MSDCDMSIEEYNQMSYDLSDDVYYDCDDQLCKFMEFLRYVYDGNSDVKSLAVVCDTNTSVRRHGKRCVFHNKMYNPVDRLICVAVEWTMEHSMDYDGYPSNGGDIAYIAWFAVRTILMCGFKDVSISQIEKQYWFNPSEFSKCFEDHKGTSCWYKVKRELGRIKYVIDMWYDCNDHFNCPDGENNTLYDEYKQYYVVNKDKLFSSFLNTPDFWRKENYEKYCAKCVIDDSDDSDYDENEEDSDYDGRKELHEKAAKEEEEYHAYWRKVYANPNYYSDEDNWIN